MDSQARSATSGVVGLCFFARMCLDGFERPGYTSNRSEITEQGVNPWRARRCNRGLPPHDVTVPHCGMGRRGDGTIRKPEDGFRRRRPRCRSVVTYRRSMFGRTAGDHGFSRDMAGLDAESVSRLFACAWNPSAVEPAWLAFLSSAFPAAACSDCTPTRAGS